MFFRLNPLSGQLDLVGSGGTSGSTPDVQTFVLSGTDITNKYVTLAASPATAADTILMVQNAPSMYFGDDFTVIGSQLGWNGLALDGILASGDKITVLYIV